MSDPNLMPEVNFSKNSLNSVGLYLFFSSQEGSRSRIYIVNKPDGDNMDDLKKELKMVTAVSN